jgi:hypothetical protein
MLTRTGLDIVKTVEQVKEHLRRTEDTDETGIRNMTIGWLESQQERLVESHREALDKIDLLTKQIDAADNCLRVCVEHPGTAESHEAVDTYEDEFLV